MNKNSFIHINLSAIRHNVKVLQSYLKSGVKHAAVVKSDAYGHGLVEVAKAVAPHVDWFAVNMIEEGVALRRAGIELPVLVFIPPGREQAGIYKKHDLTATVSASHHFSLLPKGTKYHLNFDTGMGRLGFNPEHLQEVLQLKKKHHQLQCTGLYSHFATADEEDSPKKQQQYRKFKEVHAHFGSNMLVHMCNTSATVSFPQAHFDMVRTGIGMYGYGVANGEISGLRAALQWTSRLVQVKPIKKGETASYGANWTCPGDGYIGVIPVGYADGLRRGLTGNMHVSIEGQAFSVVGTITMNYCMIYLSEHRFEEGTEVVILNKQQTAKDLADRLGTISYEILTGISPNSLRIYSN